MNVTLATNALLPADKEGGPAYSNFYLAQALLQAGARVRVVTTTRNGTDRLTVVPVDVWSEREGVPVFYASTQPGAWIRSRSYADAVDESVAASDVCIMAGIFWNHTGLSAARACWRHGVPYVTMPRGLLSPWALNHKGLKKRIYWGLLARHLVDRSASLVALAEQEARDIAAVGITLPVHIVPNGAFVEGFGEESPETAPESATPASVAPDAEYILFLGRIHPKKGLDILIPAFDRVAGSDRNVRLVIAGAVDPDYAGRFQSLLDASTARDRIVLAGNVSGEAKANLLANAAVFVLTSYSEGLPVAVLEALAAGRPIVLTPGCNLPEVAAAHAGLEVAPEVAAAADALARLLQDRVLRETLGSNARHLAQRSFSWEAVGRRMLEICRSVTVARQATPV